MLKNYLRKILFWLARRKFLGKALSLCFSYLPGFIPLDYVYRSTKTLIFQHPIGYWGSHLVAVPRSFIPTITALIGEQDAIFISEVLSIATDLHKDSLVFCNYGRFQDVALLHLHIVSGSTLNGSEPFTNKVIFYTTKVTNTTEELEKVIANVQQALIQAKPKAATLTFKPIGSNDWQVQLLT